jgi:hypothetical protein
VVIERYRREYKRATLWEDVENREGKGKIVEIDGVPETDYTYDDGEATYWSWDRDTPGDDGRDIEGEIEERAEEKAEEMVETRAREMAVQMSKDDAVDLTTKEIGRLVGEWYRDEGYSGAWVSKWTAKANGGSV